MIYSDILWSQAPDAQVLPIFLNSCFQVYFRELKERLASRRSFFHFIHLRYAERFLNSISQSQSVYCVRFFGADGTPILFRFGRYANYGKISFITHTCRWYAGIGHQHVVLRTNRPAEHVRGALPPCVSERALPIGPKHRHIDTTSIRCSVSLRGWEQCNQRLFESPDSWISNGFIVQLFSNSSVFLNHSFFFFVIFFSILFLYFQGRYSIHGG